MNVAAKVPVEIAKDHVEGVTIPLGTPVSLTGSLRVVGESQEKKSSVTGIRVQLSPMDGLAFNTPGANPREDGSFNIENLGPDKYRISAYNLPPGSWLQSVRTGDQEVLDTGLDLSGGSPASIQITLGRGTGQITGLVQDAEQKPAAGAMVALIAEPLQPERYDLNRVAWSDQNGRFTLEGIAPGNYKAYAWGDIEPGSHTDPDLLKQYDSQARKVVMKENGREQLSLVQIVLEAATAKGFRWSCEVPARIHIRTCPNCPKPNIWSAACGSCRWG